MKERVMGEIGRERKAFIGRVDFHNETDKLLTLMRLQILLTGEVFVIKMMTLYRLEEQVARNTKEDKSFEFLT